MTSMRHAAGSSDLPAEAAPGDERQPRRLAARHLSLGLVPLLAGGFLAGCGQENAYCVDDDRRVIDNEQCDDDTRTGYYGGHFWAFTGGKRYGPGQTVDPSSQRIAAADRTALSQKNGFGRATSSASGTGRSFGSSRFGSFGG